MVVSDVRAQSGLLKIVLDVKYDPYSDLVHYRLRCREADMKELCDMI